MFIKLLYADRQWDNVAMVTVEIVMPFVYAAVLFEKF